MHTASNKLKSLYPPHYQYLTERQLAQRQLPTFKSPQILRLGGADRYHLFHVLAREQGLGNSTS